MFCNIYPLFIIFFFEVLFSNTFYGLYASNLLSMSATNASIHTILSNDNVFCMYTCLYIIPIHTT